MRGLPLVDEAMLARFRARAEQAVSRMADIRRSDCLPCLSPDSDIARACSSRLDPDTEEHGFGDGPMCKHVPEAVQKAESEALTKVRADRLIKAGCSDSDAIRLIPPLRVEPPLPDRAWYEGQQDQREGVKFAMECARSFVSARDTSTLILSGATGAGKSMAAAWVVAAGPESACWISATSVDNLDRWKAVSVQAQHAPLLIIDDLGKEHVSESGWSTEQMANLITDRMDRTASGVRTIITTNLRGGELVKRYGDRFRSRMQKKPDCGYAEIGSFDLRSAKRKYLERIGEYRQFGRQ